MSRPREPYKRVMGRCRYAGGEYCVHTTENNVIKNIAPVYEVEHLIELGWGKYINFSADGVRQICQSCLCKAYDFQHQERAEREYQKEIKESYKYACESLKKIQDKLKKEGKVICRICFDKVNGGNWKRHVKHNKGGFEYNFHLLSEKCCADCSFRESIDETLNERQRRKDEKFQELKQQIDETPWGLEKLTQSMINLAESFNEISKEQAQELEKLLEKQEKKGEAEYRKEKTEEEKEEKTNVDESQTTENSQSSEQNQEYDDWNEPMRKIKNGEQVDLNQWNLPPKQREYLEEMQKGNQPQDDDQPVNNDKQPTNNKNSLPLPTTKEINEKYQNDPEKEQILNSPKLEKPEDKDQAEEYLKKVIEAELLIKRKQFNSLVLQKLKELMNRPLIYQLLNKNKRVDNALNKLQELEKQERNQLINNKENNPYLIPLLIGGVILTLIIVISAVVISRRKRKVK